MEMNRNEQIEYKLIGIAFPRFFVHPDYSGTQPVSDTEVRWMVSVNFKLANLRSDWFDIIVTLTLTLIRIKDEVTIAELLTVSTFKTLSKLSFKAKFIVVSAAINQILTHAQGAWSVKNINPNISKILPQAYNRQMDIELALKKQLYEHLE